MRNKSRECQRMHSCPIPRPRSKICTEVLWKILEIPRPRSKIWKILEIPRPRSKICTEVLWKILELDLGSWYFQDFPQDFCANLGSWSWYFQDFPQDFCANLGSWSWYFQDFPNLGSWSWYFQDFPQDFCANLGSWSWYFQDFPQDFCANLGSWSWYWAGMPSECIERILTAFLPKWTNKSCNLRAQIYIYIYMVPPKKNGIKRQPKIDTEYCKYQQK